MRDPSEDLVKRIEYLEASCNELEKARNTWVEKAHEQHKRAELAERDLADARKIREKLEAEREVLIDGLLHADESLNIDMGDGEPTYQCCNTVCGHRQECLVGKAFDLLVKQELIEWDVQGRWLRS